MWHIRYPATGSAKDIQIVTHGSSPVTRQIHQIPAVVYEKVVDAASLAWKGWAVNSNTSLSGLGVQHGFVCQKGRTLVNHSPGHLRLTGFITKSIAAKAFDNIQVWIIDAFAIKQLAQLLYTTPDNK
jgi:hypothetical protein